jgi:hypothetical protein
MISCADSSVLVRNIPVVVDFMPSSKEEVGVYSEATQK